MPPRCQNPNHPPTRSKGWLHYVEPYFGGGAVLLANDPEGISEVVNDLDLRLTDFWRTLQSEKLFQGFYRIIMAMPFSQLEYRRLRINLFGFDALVWNAVRFFVRCRQSLAGRMTSFAPLTRNRTRRGMNEQASAWLNAIDGLQAIHRRMSRVVVLCEDALTVIRQQDGPRTLFYLDPPYLHETRTATQVYGDLEMGLVDHLRLLVTLGGVKAARAITWPAGGVYPKWWDKAKPIKGRFLLSGYRSAVYDQVAAACGWKRHEKKIDNKAAGGKSKRVMTECVWTNY